MEELKGKKLLVLGGAAMTKDIVNMAHFMGAYVIVTDYYDTHRSPAKLIADEYWDVSINDYDKLSELIKEKHTMNYKNIDILKSLNGNMQVSTTCKKVEACIYTNLPTIYENVKSYNESQLSDYYKNNTPNIKSQLHIISEKSFINLINKAKEANCDLTNDYKSCEFMFIDNKINFKVNYNNGKTIEAQLVGDNSASIAFDF